VREAVLGGAELADGSVLIDVGCGDGMIGVAALDRVGESGRVIFVDVSAGVIGACRERVGKRGAMERADFVVASADGLEGVADATADAVTTRSVLIYVADKRRALTSFFRVLRDGGRLSIWEPINAYDHPERDGRFMGYDVRAVQALAERVRAAYNERQPPETDPMMNFDERELFAAVEAVGFETPHLTLQISDRAPRAVDDWHLFLDSAPNPLAPTLGEAVRERLTVAESVTFLDHLRPLAERGEGRYRYAAAHLRARKPATA
jgi:ubiquinone/menaquinone biosynthesis C-methylase UbiE